MDVVRMRIATVDLVSNTCFPALAAAELGAFEREGLDARIELIPSLAGTRALRDGVVDAVIAGSVHDILREFARWSGAKLVVALSQGTPWLLVVRADLAARRGDIGAVKGLRLTAAEGPDLALRQMFIGAQIDPDRDVEMIDLPGAKARDVSFGVFAARALEQGLIDAFSSMSAAAMTPLTSATSHSRALAPPMPSSNESRARSKRPFGPSSKPRRRCAPIHPWRARWGGANFLPTRPA
jgi:ABC-type nitrate/sulfonate/bicarbonate transport system substrate-binding protein